MNNNSKLSVGAWTQEDIYDSIHGSNQPSAFGGPGKAPCLKDFGVVYKALEKDYNRVKNEFKKCWDLEMSKKDRENMVRCINPYCPQFHGVLPKDEGLVEGYYLVPEINLEDLCKDSGEEGSLLWLIERTLGKGRHTHPLEGNSSPGFIGFVVDCIQHVKEMERVGTLGERCGEGEKDFVWRFPEDDFVVANSWEIIKASLHWKEGLFNTFNVRNGVYERLNTLFRLLLSMVDEFRTEILDDYKKRSISVLVGCCVCSEKLCPDGAPLKTCSSCHQAWYCSREHQVQDWKNHKENCKIAASVNFIPKKK